MYFKIIPALDDNYMYIIIDENSKEAVVVDPVEAKKIVKEIGKIGAKLTTVLTTHHHWDHAGGNAELLQLKPDLKVYGGDMNIAGLTKQVTHSDQIVVGSLKITCLLTPCHTRGHICYLIEDTKNSDPGAVFTGDTLFQAGCGKFFEGNADEMYTALIKILGSLPDETKVFCGHEYTANNLLFANHVEPDNKDVQERLVWAKEMKKSKLPTVPSTIIGEKSFNPFMRVHEASVQKHTGEQNPIKVMETLRNEKNNFSKRI